MRLLRLPWLLAVVLVACGPTIPTEQRAVGITVVYDPATGNLPTPNDAALVDGLVTIAPNALLSDSENQLKATFNGRPGFSSGSSVRVQFTAPIAASSISSTTVLAYDLGATGAGPATEVSVARTYAPCDTSVTLTSPTGFTPGHRYLFAVRGGESGVQGAEGQQVVASPAFHFLRAGKDLTQHADAMPGKTRTEKKATAARLEALRGALEPHFETLEKNGVPRAQVMALWTATIHGSTEAYLDPGSKRVPFPNELLKDSATGLVNLPPSSTDTPDQAHLKASFNELDGFSTTAALLVDFSAPVERTSITPQSVRLFRADGVEFTDLTRTLSTNNLKLTLQPNTPLDSGTAYVVVIAGVTDSQAAPLAPMPLASVLALGLPLVDGDGKSSISSFCDAQAQQLEPLRSTVSAVLEASKTTRASVNVAWTFTTQDIAKRAQELWSAPYENNLPLDVTGLQTTPGGLLLGNVGNVVTGNLTIWERLDPVTKAFRANGGGAQKSVPFVLALPKSARSGDTVRVVVFGHGLNTERRLALFLANRLAQAGFATLAIDFAFHGERTVCRQNNECALGHTCAADGTCLNGTQPGDLRRSPGIPGVPGPGTPTATGGAWIDVGDLPGTRDHFRQAMLDLSALTRIIKLKDWKSATGGIALHPDDIKYAGISLGGIIGGEVSGMDPNFQSMLLNVGGAGLVDLMQESGTFGPTLRNGLAAKGITPGTPEWDSFLNAARWLLDEVDPINLAPFAKTKPLRYVDPVTKVQATARPKKLRLQMALGDTVVPNSSTRRLVKACGINETTEFREFIGTHGFLADPVEPAFGPGQNDMANFLENN